MTWWLPEVYWPLQGYMEDGYTFDQDEESGVLTIRDIDGAVAERIQMVRFDAAIGKEQRNG